MVVLSDQTPEGLSFSAAASVSKSCAGLREVVVPVDAANANGGESKQAIKLSSKILIWSSLFERRCRCTLIVKREVSRLDFSKWLLR